MPYTYRLSNRQLKTSGKSSRWAKKGNNKKLANYMYIKEFVLLSRLLSYKRGFKITHSALQSSKLIGSNLFRKKVVIFLLVLSRTFEILLSKNIGLFFCMTHSKMGLWHVWITAPCPDVVFYMDDTVLPQYKQLTNFII